MLGEILTAIVTPFDAEGAVDYERFRELAQYLVENGSDGIVVAGTTGESPTLTDDERLELFRVAVDTLNGRGTVIAGTGTYSTAHSVHLTAEAHALGVDGFLVVTPYYNKPPARGIVEHFRRIADVSDRPIVVYNIPSRVVINIEPDTIAELSEIPTVRAVKQANDDLEQARRVLAETDLDVYAGDDNLIYPFLELGGVGVISVLSHVVGPRLKEMNRAFRGGDEEAASDAPHHRSVSPHQSGKSVLVPASQEAGQEFPIGHPVPVRPEIGQKVLEDHAQRAGRHRLQPRRHRHLYLSILAAGRSDPPV